MALIDKDHFVSFLLREGILKFGSFVTKSGRETPFFLNLGDVNSGSRLQEIGRAYAAQIWESFGNQPTVVFGPAYKGISLSVAAALAWKEVLESNSQSSEAESSDLYFSYNRKEAKNHGDKGQFVGKVPSAGDRIVIVEDVVTAGTTLAEIVPRLREIDGVEVLGVVIAVDRMEKRSLDETVSAREALEQQYDFPIVPLVDLNQIMKAVLSDPSLKSNVITDSLLSDIKSYIANFGAGAFDF